MKLVGFFYHEKIITLGGALALVIKGEAVDAADAGKLVEVGGTILNIGNAFSVGEFVAESASGAESELSELDAVGGC